MRKLRTGAMPPANAPQPSAAGSNRAGFVAGVVARRRRRGASESGPHRHVPSSQSDRVSERHPRPAGARHRRRVASARPMTAVTASTTSPSATCRRRSWTGTSRPRRRSAGWRSAARRRPPQSDMIRLPPDLTQEEHVARAADRHARRACRLRTRSRRMASTTSRSGSRAIETGSVERPQRSGIARAGRAARPDARQDVDDREPADGDDTTRRRRPEGSCPVTAGPHQLGVTFLKNAVVAARNGAAAAPVAFQHAPSSPSHAGDFPGVDHRPVCGEGGRRHAEPPADLRLPARRTPRDGRRRARSRFSPP